MSKNGHKPLIYKKLSLVFDCFWQYSPYNLSFNVSIIFFLAYFSNSFSRPKSIDLFLVILQLGNKFKRFLW